MPARIKRERTKGWRAPEGAVYVGRPTIWGNPFWHAQRFCGVDVCLRMYEQAVSGIWDPFKFKDVPDGPFHVACQDFSRFIKKFHGDVCGEIKHNLRGKDLMCWCKIYDSKGFRVPCHADILISVANDIPLETVCAPLTTVS